jgi:hypothetical protein
LKQIDTYDKAQGQMVVWIRLREYSESGDKVQSEENEEEEEVRGEGLRNMHDPQANIDQPVDEDDNADDPEMKTRKTIERCFKISRQGLERWNRLQKELEGVDEENPLTIVT